MELVLEENKTVGGVIATFKLEEYLRTWGDISYGDIAVDGLVDFLGSLPTDGEFTIGGVDGESYEGFYTDDDALEMLNYSLSHTVESSGDYKDKSINLEFYITYNGPANHQMFLDFLKSYKLEGHFTFEIKQKTIPTTKRIKDDDHNGVKELRDENGNLIMTYTLKNNKVHGELVAYHENGQVCTRIELANNKFCGPTYTEYYDNGQVAQIVYYPKSRKAFSRSGAGDGMINHYPGRELRKETYHLENAFREYIRLGQIRYDETNYEHRWGEGYHWNNVYYRKEHKIDLKVFYPSGKLKLTIKNRVYTEYFEDGTVKMTNLKGQSFIKDDNGEFTYKKFITDGIVDDYLSGAEHVKTEGGKLVGEGRFCYVTYTSSGKYIFSKLKGRYVTLDIDEDTGTVVLSTLQNKNLSFIPNDKFLGILKEVHDKIIVLSSEKEMEKVFELFEKTTNDEGQITYVEDIKEEFSAGEATKYVIKETLDIGLDWASKDTPSYEITWTINGDEKVGKYDEENGGGLYCEKNTETGEQTQYLPNGEKLFEIKKNEDGSCSIWFKEYKPELRFGHDYGNDSIRKIVNNN